MGGTDLNYDITLYMSQDEQERHLLDILNNKRLCLHYQSLGENYVRGICFNQISALTFQSILIKPIKNTNDIFLYINEKKRSYLTLFPMYSLFFNLHLYNFEIQDLNSFSISFSLSILSSNDHRSQIHNFLKLSQNFWHPFVARVFSSTHLVSSNHWPVFSHYSFVYCKFHISGKSILSLCLASFTYHNAQEIQPSIRSLLLLIAK